ncbi:MAG: ParA family protein [Chloroflexi bacterium]|nr:MAG: ParA family protein [Chloroflexota bacterium]MBL1195865.1 ParA family protein [Chloroflexota bacterium]NOH13157.1 ParA family protein [Chloroflexota bacterium]
MRRVIAVANQKGGVGKTTTVVNLGAALADLGYRVALIDLDSQGAMTVSFGLNPYTTKPSMVNLLLNKDIALSDVAKSVAERLQVAPAGSDLLSAEYRLLKQPDRTTRLRDAIEKSRDDVDYVLIDTPPNLGLLTVNGLVAANQLLIPVKTEYLAMRGVRPLLESVWLIRDRINPDLQLLGVVPTMHGASPNADAIVSEMSKVFRNKLLKSTIPMDEAAAVAPASRQTVLDYRPASRAAVAYRELAKEVSDVLR